MPVTITVAANGGLDLRWATLYNLFANATIQDGGTGTEFTAVVTGAFDGNDANVRFVIQGTGFTFSGSFPAIELTGGTIADITMQTEAGVTLATFFGFAIDGATFAAALDTYSAGGPGTPDQSALDAIFRALSYNTAGGGGNDTLEGGDSGDVLDGGGGNDIAIGGAGADALDGGAGTLDRASYITSAAGLTADLLTSANNTGDAAGDTYANIEGLEGSAFDDDLRGNNNNNFLIGGVGADVLNGRGGADSAAYITATTGVTASLANSGANTGDAAGDTYVSIENLSGSNFDDTLIGDTNNNFLNGRGGADALDGGAGFDTADYFLSSVGLTVDLDAPGNNTGEAAGDTYTSIENLRGSAFADDLRGNSGSNLLDGQAGADVLDGGTGFDYAWYNTNSTGTGVTASLANPGINTGDAAGDVYISIEGLVGSAVADTLIGNSANNFLRGQGGGDSLIGGGGFDFADYINAASGVTIDLANASNNTGEALGDTFVSIEGIRGSAFNDILRGDDVLNGGNAVNELIGGLGADTIDGGGGFDYADYRNSAIGLIVSLANSAINTGEAAGDVFISIEGLIGSDNDDTLIGDGGSNFIAGGLGADAIDGGDGIDYAAYFRSSVGLTVSLANPADNTGEAIGDTFTSIEGIRGSDFDDILIGDSGDNFLGGGSGGDVLDGGVGSDTAYYQLWTAQVGLIANLSDASQNTGDAADDIYISIENLWGSNFNDTLVGDENDNVLTGVDGDDILIGNGGADTLDGGDGTDTASYITSASGLIADLQSPSQNAGDAAGDSYASIERLEGSNFNDNLRGNSGDNILVGAAGNDILIGRAGADSLDGGAGNLDRASYITATAGLTADLLTPSNNTDDAAGDTYSNIEGLEGSNFDNVLRGDNSNNFLIGGAGSDFLDGRGGFDFASYISAATGVTASLATPGINTGDAAGDAYLSIEHLSGSNFDDTLIGDANNNFLMGRVGADSHQGGNGFDTADYFLSTIGLTVDLATPASNTGEAIGDTYASIENLRGSAFDDVLRGSSGTNLLDGQAGADVLDGGAGFDYAWYNTNSTGTGVTASLANPGINTGDAAGDVYISIEGLIGSSVADTLIGDAGDNFLRGQGGADVLDGGAGADYADYFNSTIGITVDLANPLNNTGEAAGDTYISIERVRGSAFDDVLRGNQFSNTLRGGLGADTLDGGAGNDFASYSDSSVGLTASLANAAANTGEAAGDVYISIESLRGGSFADTLIGDAGDNFLNGGDGADLLDGGAGADYADYFNSTIGVTVDLANPFNNTGEAAGDTYISIEKVRGGAFDDVLRGNQFSNTLRGGLGADTLDGGAGHDFASYSGSAVGLTASLANAADNTGEAIGNVYISIESLRGSDFADTLIGNSGSNFLQGGRAAMR